MMTRIRVFVLTCFQANSLPLHYTGTSTPLPGNETDRCMTPQVLQPEGHSLEELAWRLSKVRGKKVPLRTLRWWLFHLRIEPNEFGLYDDRDLAILTSLVLFLKRVRSIEKFKNLLVQEISTDAP